MGLLHLADSLSVSGNTDRQIAQPNHSYSRQKYASNDRGWRDAYENFEGIYAVKVIDLTNENRVI